MMPVFAGMSAALLALALVIGQTIVAQRDARERAMHEGDTLFALNEVMLAMLNGETGQRGYLLTGKSEYLTPYLNAKQRRDRAIARLREIPRQSFDPDFPERIDRLDGMSNAKFAELDRSVALAQKGFPNQALALVQSDFGKLQMDAIRREIGRLSVAGANRRRDAFERADTLEHRLLPLVGILGIAIFALVYAGFRAEHRLAMAEVEAGQAAALREANERAELLARELSHRVKNLFSVILSIVTLSGRKQAPSHELLSDIRDRIRALSLAHSVSQGSFGTTRVGLGALVGRTMEPYADEGGTRVRVRGPEVQLPVRMVTPLGLIIHELATNAVKYGALSVGSGAIEISWQVDSDNAAAPLLMLSWVETGGPPIAPEIAASAGGFGTQMTTFAARQLGGAVEREWPISGAVARLKFPLA